MTYVFRALFARKSPVSSFWAPERQPSTGSGSVVPKGVMRHRVVEGLGAGLQTRAYIPCRGRSLDPRSRSLTPLAGRLAFGFKSTGGGAQLSPAPRTRNRNRHETSAGGAARSRTRTPTAQTIFSSTFRSQARASRNGCRSQMRIAPSLKSSQGCGIDSKSTPLEREVQ